MNKRSSGNPRQKSSLRHWSKTMITRTLFLCGLGAVTGLTVVLLNGHQLNTVSAQSIQPKVVAQTFKLPTATASPVVSPQAIPTESPAVEVSPTATPEAKPADAQKEKEGKPEDRTTADAQKQAGLGPLSQYILSFNRSPAIGNRFRLEGTFSEARVGFTRPRPWKIKTAKAFIRFQHSPALVAEKSDLVVRVNDTSIGSVPLNLKNSQIGEASFDIPLNLLQDQNEITIVAQQQNSPTCSNPDDKSLWSEVLPDSKIVFDYQNQQTTLDFSRYPYPFFDQFGLDTTRVNYLLPSDLSETWMTAASRFQTNFGRLADFRPVETALTKDLKKFQWGDRVVVIGTPNEQPLLKSLKLPFTIANNQVLDGSKSPFPENIGVLMMTTTGDGSVPVLIITGNGPEGVSKAAQFLMQPDSSKIGAGTAVVVSDVTDTPSPQPREWGRYLPLKNNFKLSELTGLDNQPFKDTTVRGSSAPPVQFHFRALPDDLFLRGSWMNMKYSYSAGVNPRLSTLSVRVDGVGVGSKKLESDNGGQNETFNVNLPENLIKPDSVIDVSFDLYAKDSAKCGQATDQQLWGTVHSDTTFDVRRENSVELPDLKLLTTGFPVAAPQDLSKAAIVLPDMPAEADVMTMLKFSERMGRLSQAGSVKMDVYKSASLPETVRNDRHLIAIGARDRFPVKQAMEETGKFKLLDVFGRQSGNEKIQTLPDASGVIKSVMSPWNSDRVLIALSGQTDAGLKQIQDIFTYDMWFYQLKNDTVLINANPQVTNAYDSNAYQLQFLDQADKRRIEDTNLLSKARRFFQDNWYMVPVGILVATLLLYGVAQQFLKRIAG
jgi:cellulose synthase operon protein B